MMLIAESDHLSESSTLAEGARFSTNAGSQTNPVRRLTGCSAGVGADDSFA
jgi:hypothetical protein